MRHKSWDNAPRLEAAAQYLIGLGVAAPIAYVGAYIGITMVTSWALNALSPKSDFGAAGQRGLLTNVREANAPQEIVYGEVRKGGIITYMEATGTDNEYLHMIITLAGHEPQNIHPKIYRDTDTKYLLNNKWDRERTSVARERNRRRHKLSRSRYRLSLCAPQISR